MAQADEAEQGEMVTLRLAANSLAEWDGHTRAAGREALLTLLRDLTITAWVQFSFDNTVHWLQIPGAYWVNADTDEFLHELVYRSKKRQSGTYTVCVADFPRAFLDVISKSTNKGLSELNLVDLFHLATAEYVALLRKSEWDAFLEKRPYHPKQKALSAAREALIGNMCMPP